MDVTRDFASKRVLCVCVCVGGQPNFPTQFPRFGAISIGILSMRDAKVKASSLQGNR